jgi:hypothetical protein
MQAALVMSSVSPPRLGCLRCFSAFLALFHPSLSRQQADTLNGFTSSNGTKTRTALLTLGEMIGLGALCLCGVQWCLPLSCRELSANSFTQRTRCVVTPNPRLPFGSPVVCMCVNCVHVNFCVRCVRYDPWGMKLCKPCASVSVAGILHNNV